MIARPLLCAKDATVVELVDALVDAVDLHRSQEVDRLRDALVPLGLVQAFDDEVRLNGRWSGCMSPGCDLCSEAMSFDVEVAF